MARTNNENNIMAQVDKILALQGADVAKRKWTQMEHVLLLRLVIEQESGKPMTPDRRAALQELLSTKGLGGNASQFRQWLEGEKLVPAGTKLATDVYKGL